MALRADHDVTLLSSLLRLVVVVLLLLCHLFQDVYSEKQICPEECSCIDTFVSCDEFTNSTLHRIPRDVQSLILRGGTIRSFPRTFLTCFPHLSFLEIQSTQMEAIVRGTFSGVRGLDHLAVTDCSVDIVETGAFEDVRNMSRILISDSQIGTVQPGAFSAISDVEELSIVSSRIEEVGRGSFVGLSDIRSFTLALNNVTAFNAGAFREVSRFGKVQMYRNNLHSFSAGVLLPLMAASEEAEVVSNNVDCQCSSVQAFQRPEMARFLQSQMCTVAETGQVLKLSEVNVSELCLSQPVTPSPTGTPTDFQSGSSTATFSRTTIHPASVASAKSTAPAAHASTHQFSPSLEAGGENAAGTESTLSSTFSHGTGSNSSPSSFTRFADVSTPNGVTGSDKETTVHHNDKTQNGSFSEDSSGAVSGSQASFVFLLASCFVSWLVSLLLVRQQPRNTQ